MSQPVRPAGSTPSSRPSRRRARASRRTVRAVPRWLPSSVTARSLLLAVAAAAMFASGSWTSWHG